MSTDNDPIWSARLDVVRASGSFEDLAHVVRSTFQLYSKAEKFISPWNAKQMDAKFYTPPSRETLKEMLGSHGKNLNEFTFSAFTHALIRFCEKHKGRRQLPMPHPSTHHSTHWPEGTFEIRDLGRGDDVKWPIDAGPGVTSLSELKLFGIREPMYVKNLRLREFKYLIVRPKLSKLGTASATAWEALLFKSNHGFLVEHVDSNLNPRYAGIF